MVSISAKSTRLVVGGADLLVITEKIINRIVSSTFDINWPCLRTIIGEKLFWGYNIGFDTPTTRGDS